MIVGIGTDIAAVKRLGALYERHGIEALKKLLAESEFADFEKAANKAKFLAKRFAAKEALGKALGTGVAAPAVLPNIAVVHDPQGKPAFAFAPALQTLMETRKLQAHLSISDEEDYALAFVVLEQIS